MFVFGGFAASMMRLELLQPDGTLVDPETYNKLFTMHGVVMVWFFLIPSIPAVLGNFLVPLMIGARDLAFPTLNLLSWYIYIVGAAFTLWVLIDGGVDTGWTFYTPFSTSASTTNVVATALGIFIVGFSSILTGLNFIVTMHRMRAPGLTWFRMPLFLWSMYATSVIMVLATPVLAITLLLVADRARAARGLLRSGAGRRSAAVPEPVLVLLAPGGVHHDPAGHGRGQRAHRRRSRASRSSATTPWRLPAWRSPCSASWCGATTCSCRARRRTRRWCSRCSATWWRSRRRSKSSTGPPRCTGARSRFHTPLLYALGFIGLFTIGGLTGLFLASLAVDVDVHGTYFVVAHFHYIMVGGMVMAFMGGLHYWWPKITGRMYDEMWAKIAAVTIFLGFNLTFFPQYILGYLGMPRRYHSYPAEFQVLNVMSTAGASILAIGYLLPLIYLLASLRWGKLAGPESVGRRPGLEWQTASPPPKDNFLDDAGGDVAAVRLSDAADDDAAVDETRRRWRRTSTPSSSSTSGRRWACGSFWPPR